MDIPTIDIVFRRISDHMYLALDEVGETWWLFKPMFQRWGVFSTHDWPFATAIEPVHMTKEQALDAFRAKLHAAGGGVYRVQLSGDPQ